MLPSAAQARQEAFHLVDRAEYELRGGVPVTHLGIVGPAHEDPDSAVVQRPERVFVSELRTGDEVYDYLVSVNTGHPGSITSVHADSAEMAFVALAQLMKRSQAGQGMSTREGVELAQTSVDVVVQCARDRNSTGSPRIVREIWYDPGTKHRGLS